MPKLTPLLLVVGCVAAACLATPPALAGDRDPIFEERPGILEPPLFRDARGGAFRPRDVIVVGPRSAMAARVSQNPRRTRSENRLDLSGVPLVGSLFRGTLDVASVRRAPLVGRVYRVGDALVVETARVPSELAGRRVALATNVPRYGAVSFELGRLDWQPTTPPTGHRVEIGSAHLVGGDLVLASQGGEPAFPSVRSLFGDLF